MALKVLIVDDEVLARSRLRTLLSDCADPNTEVVGEAGNAVQAMDLLAHTRCDLVLLDIHMPGVDGIALAAALRALPAPPWVVFVTAYAEHAVQAFELEAVDYLTKPVRPERLQQALQKAQRRCETQQDLSTLSEALIIVERGRGERVALSDILYFKAELKYITVRTVEKEHIYDGSLNELEHKYAHLFVRVHRNALVARRCVRTLEKHHDVHEGDSWVVRLDEIHECLPVSRRQLAAVREALRG